MNARTYHRPNNTPAYYLGQPATVWITAMRPRRAVTVNVARFDGLVAEPGKRG